MSKFMQQHDALRAKRASIADRFAKEYADTLGEDSLDYLDLWQLGKVDIQLALRDELNRREKNERHT